MVSDFIVIGAGIIGLSTALRLLEEGASVTLLDRRKAGCEASWAGGGILSPLYPWNYSDSVTRLAAFSISRYPEWTTALHIATDIDPEYQICGLVILPPYDPKVAINWCSTHAIPLIYLSSSYHSESSWAHINDKRANTQALFLPEIAQVRNPYLLQALYKRIRQLGGTIIEYCEVHELEIFDQKVRAIRTTLAEKFSANQYILSAGAWSRKILGRYALNLTIKPICGQMLLYKLVENPLHSIVLQQDLYLIPRRDGHLLVGSTIEDIGFDKHITLNAKNRLSNWAEKILPQLKNTPPLKHWSGLRPAAPGNIPIIGPHPFLENLYINSGHFRYGVTMAPGSAEILVNNILKHTQPFDITPYQTGWHPSGIRYIY